MKKWVGLLLSMVMMLCMVTTSFAANTEAEQVVAEGGTLYYKADGTSTNDTTFPGGQAVVKLSKTVATTGVENEFEVTLQVSTTQDIRELHSDTPDAAVMLVMDVSNSMDDCDICGMEATHLSHHSTYPESGRYCPDNSGNFYTDGWDQGSSCDNCGNAENSHTYRQRGAATGTKTHDYASRLSKSKAAAIEFLDQFAKNTGAEEDDARYVAIVDFGSTSYRRLNWVDVTNESQLASAKAIINSLTVAHSGVNGVSDSGGTNIEGALMLGANVWGANTTVKALDYKYTILLTDGNPTFHVTDNANDRNSTSKIEGTVGGSSETKFEDAKDVGVQAERILDLGGLSRLYSICYGSVTEGNNRAERVWDKKPFSNWSNANPATTSNMTIGQWLEAFSTKAFDGAETENLFDSFKSVISQIQLATQAWKVNDIMGEHMVWGGEVPVNNVTNQSRFAGNALSWDVLSSDYFSLTNHRVGSTTYPVLTYTYKYKVTLDNLDTTYDGVVNTNQEATLTFAVKDNTTDLWETVDPVAFPKPTVKGYEGSLTFTKGWLNNNQFTPLAGVQFTLTSKNPSAEGRLWTATATSNNRGEVTFTGLPSGHSYSLVETNHEGYADLGAMTVDVALGVANFSRLNAAGQLINEKSDKDVTLVLNKEFGSTDHPDTITFTIVNSAAGYSNTVTLPTPDNKWSITLSGLTPGQYVITEAADWPGYDMTQSATLNGNATPITYNNVKVDLGLNDNESHRTHTVTFKNTYTRQMGEISVVKTFLEREHDDLLAGSTNPDMVAMEDSLVAGLEIEVDLVDAAGKTAASVVLNKGNNWSASFGKLPVGEYTISEHVDGVIPDHDFVHLQTYVNGVVSTNNRITVGKNSEIKLALENHYTHQMGDLRILKSIAGVDASAFPADSVFEVDVYATELVNGNYVKTGNPVTTIKLTKLTEGPWRGASIDLPVGVYYLEERAPVVDGYDFISGTFQLNENLITVVPGSTTATVLLTNIFAEQTGDLTVTKNFVLPTLDADETFPYPASITVNVLDGSASGAIVETLQLTAGNNWTASVELPLGNYYLSEVVAEGVPGSADVAGYGMKASWSSSNVTITNGAEVKSTVINTYTRDYGTVTISKKFSGVPDNLAAGATVTFVIYENNGGVRGDVVESITLPDNSGKWSKSIHLPTGKYFLYEYGAHNAFENYTLTGVTFNDTIWYQPSDQPLTAVKGYEFSVADHGAQIALSAVNTYAKDTAKLTIKKVFDADSALTAYFADKSINVLIRHNGTDIKTVTLSAPSWSATLTDLEVGEKYTLVEVIDKAGTNTAYHPDYDLSYSWSEGSEVTLKKGDDVTNVVTNTYTKKTGTMTLQKIFDGIETADVALLDNVDIKVTVIPVAGGNTQTITLNKANNWRSGAITLPVGSYTISEAQIMVNGYTHKEAEFGSISGQVSDGGNNSLAAVVQITADQTSAVNVVLTNTMERQTGSLTITKAFKFEKDSELTEAKFANIDVLVKHGGSLYQTVTLNAGNNWTVTLKDVPTGAYTVEEVTAAGAANTAHVDNYGLRVVYSNQGNVVVTNSATPAEMKITNEYSEHVGYIRVRKTFEQDADSLAAEKFINRIAILVLDEDGNLEGTAYVSRNVGGTALIGPLPVGTYKLVEVVDKGAADSAYVEGYALISTWDVANDKVTVVENDTAEATVHNKYSRDKGSLTIKKVFEGCTDITKPEITVYVKQGDTTVRTVKLNRGNNWAMTLNDLPTGMYTVVEDETTAAVAKHSVAVTYSAKNVEVGSAPATMTITNTYTHDQAKLTIIKDFADHSALTGDDIGFINVRILQNGVRFKEVLLTAEAGWTWSGMLPVGDYVVQELTEANVNGSAYRPGYGLNVNYSGTHSQDGSVTVSKDATKSAEVRITNNYSSLPGSLVITKAFQGPQHLYPISVEFTIAGVGSSQKVTLSAANNWTAQIYGLNAGEYTVTENVLSGSGYDVTTSWSSEGGKITILPGQTATLTCTNTYYEKQNLSFRIPVEKKVRLTDANAPEEMLKFSFGAAWQGSDNVSVRFESDPSNTLGAFQQTSANTYAATLSGEGTVRGYIVIQGYADDLAGFKLQTWENLTGFASEEAAVAAGWTFDKTATDSSVVWNIQLGYNGQGELAATVLRTDGVSDSQVSFENVYISPIIMPPTGDRENIELWIGLCAISVLGAAIMFIIHRKKASAVVK